MKKGAIWGVLFLIASISIICGQEYSQVWNKVSSEVFNDDFEGIAVYVFEEKIPKGTEISSWQHNEKAPTECYFFFVDDFPDANWEHPCRYIFATKDEIIIHNRLAPPKFLNVMAELTNYEFETYSVHKDLRTVSSVKRSLEETELDYCWAVLISGGGNSGSNYPRYYNDVQFMYETLISYGYYDDHIIVLFADGTNPAADQSGGANSDPDLDSDGDDDIQYSCTPSNLSMVFSDLSSTLTSSDQLFIYSTDHGGGGGTGDSDVYLVGWGENIDDSVFARWLEPIECSTIIVTMEQCFSGGFIDDLAGEGRIITTAARFDEVSWGGVTSSLYDEFVYHWTSAVNGETPFGDIADADTTDDDMISMAEAYAYALEEDLADEHPQYSSTPENFGETAFLFGTISDAPFIFKSGEQWYELSGDLDDVFDPDEQYSFIPELLNLGLDASNVTAILRTSEADVTILDSILEIPSMTTRDTSFWGLDSFILNIENRVEYGDTLDFIIDITAEDDYSTMFGLSIVLPQPEIVLSDHSIIDDTGDSDGFVDPGESVEMNLSFTNIGIQEANSMSCVVSSTNPDITITQNVTTLTMLDPSELLVGESPIEFTFSSSGEEYDIIEFTANITASGGYSKTIPFTVQASGQYVYPYTGGADLWTISSGWHITERRRVLDETAWYCGSEADYLYPHGSELTIESSHYIALPPNPVLIIDEFLAVEPNYDDAIIEYYSPGDVEWTSISSRSYYDPPWKALIVDLSDISSSAAKIRFRLSSDSGVNAEGWYLDNINVISDPGRGVFCGYVVQEYGLPGNTFKFRATWYDSTGQEPENAIVFVDYVPYAMEYKTGFPNSGSVYEVDCIINTFGEHCYEFQFDDIHTETIDGPYIIPARDSFSFAESNEGFTHFGDYDDWSWGACGGLPSSGALGNVWATNLSGDYQLSSSSSLLSPSLNISEYTLPYLVIRHWYQTNDVSPESGPLYGACNLKIIEDGSDDLILSPLSGYDGVISVSNSYIGREQGFGDNLSGNFWHTNVFDLTDLDLTDFHIQFDLGARNTSEAELGWYISDIYLLDAIDLSVFNESNPSLPKEFGITTYPNPFNTVCNISYNLPVQYSSGVLQIVDINGRTIESKNVNRSGVFKLDMIHNESGVYLVRIVCDNKITSSEKLIYIK